MTTVKEKRQEMKSVGKKPGRYHRVNEQHMGNSKAVASLVVNTCVDIIAQVSSHLCRYMRHRNLKHGIDMGMN